MKVLTLMVIVSFCEVRAEEFKLAGLFFGCDRDVTLEYHRGLQDFSTRLYKKVALQYGDHFALSQYSIWLSLSAIAEGAKGAIQQQLFKSLNLPDDPCLREKYYEIATSLESPGNDIRISRQRLLVLNNSLRVNSTWMHAVRASGLVDTKITSFKSAEETNQITELIGIPSLNFTGSAMILDSLDYEGVWTTAFHNATTEKADFYNDDGVKIGAIDMLRIKMRVKLAHIPLLNAKLLELPVGNNGRYRMLFIMNLGKNSLQRTIEHFPSSFIIDSTPLLMESIVPLEVGIPKFSITSAMDLKNVLEDIGLGSIWTEGINAYISDPPATPTTLIQRVTIRVDESGLDSPPSPGFTDFATGIATAIGRDFIANRPFIFGLVDAQTRTWLFSGAFSKPGDFN